MNPLRKNPINVELLEKTLGHIEEHPEEWNQNSWVCETAACFAGNALLLEGLERVYSTDMICGCGCGEVVGHHPSPQLNVSLLKTKDGESYNIRQLATCVLGLTEDEARDLFCGSNSMKTLRWRVAELKRRAEQEAEEDAQHD